MENSIYCKKYVIDDEHAGMTDDGSYRMYHPACRSDIGLWINLPHLDWKYDSEYSRKMGRNARTNYATYRIESAFDSFSGARYYKVFINGKIRAEMNDNLEARMFAAHIELAYMQEAGFYVDVMFDPSITEIQYACADGKYKTKREIDAEKEAA